VLCLGAILNLAAIDSSAAETLPEALVKAYQSNPQLNADRARQRGTDENVPQALAGYRPQIVASLSAGLQAVRNLLPDNAVSRPPTAFALRNFRSSPDAKLYETPARACCWTR
jgi:outer membrane protein